MQHLTDGVAIQSASAWPEKMWTKKNDGSRGDRSQKTRCCNWFSKYGHTKLPSGVEIHFLRLQHDIWAQIYKRKVCIYEQLVGPITWAVLEDGFDSKPFSQVGEKKGFDTEEIHQMITGHWLVGQMSYIAFKKQFWKFLWVSIFV